MNGVSFKGLWRITGQPENVKNNTNRLPAPEALSELRTTKVESFLNDTKKYRSASGYSFLNPDNGDYYIAVSDKYDSEFGAEADSYNIDCTFLGNKVARNSDPDESSKLYKKMFDLKKQQIEFTQKFNEWKKNFRKGE